VRDAADEQLLEGARLLSRGVARCGRNALLHVTLHLELLHAVPAVLRCLACMHCLSAL